MSDTFYKKVDYQMSKIVGDLELGEIGLSGIERAGLQAWFAVD